MSSAPPFRAGPPGPARPLNWGRRRRARSSRQPGVLEGGAGRLVVVKPQQTRGPAGGCLLPPTLSRVTAERYWQGPAEDEAMQDAHQFVWEAMLESVDVPVAQKRILDVGCNRGGFLRYLADSFHIGEGFGYDPAAGAIQDARALAGGRPLTFEAAEGVPTAWGGFDVAFSHEVLYLLHDLKAHASALFEALVPGGVYFAVMGVHSASPMIAE